MSWTGIFLPLAVLALGGLIFLAFSNGAGGWLVDIFTQQAQLHKRKPPSRWVVWFAVASVVPMGTLVVFHNVRPPPPVKQPLSDAKLRLHLRFTAAPRSGSLLIKGGQPRTFKRSDIYSLGWESMQYRFRGKDVWEVHRGGHGTAQLPSDISELEVLPSKDSWVVVHGPKIDIQAGEIFRTGVSDLKSVSAIPLYVRIDDGDWELYGPGTETRPGRFANLSGSQIELRSDDQPFEVYLRPPL